MHKAKRMGQLTIGMLLSTAGLADETKYPDANAGQRTVETSTVESLLVESAYPSHWQLHRPNEADHSANDWRQPFVDVDFQDNSALGRVSKIRNLSLLTLAESQRTRLFLGVNDDGLVGLHFIAVPKFGERRFLSLARMPYLKKDEPASTHQ